MKENKSLKDIINHRIEKLNKIKESKIESFPYSFKSNTKIVEIFENEKKLQDKKITVSGRIISLRRMGKACFIHIQDEVAKIQLYIKTDNLDDGVYNDIVRNLDIGDIIGVSGQLFYTKTEELSLKISEFKLLSKNIRPLPNQVPNQSGVRLASLQPTGGAGGAGGGTVQVNNNIGGSTNSSNYSVPASSTNPHQKPEETISTPA